jgi:hypothetical protein
MKRADGEAELSTHFVHFMYVAISYKMIAHTKGLSSVCAIATAEDSEIGS